MDARIFYAFCRVIDDLADDESQPLSIRRDGLNAWKNGVLHGFPEPSPLQREILDMRERRAIPTQLLAAIIDGCASDLEPQRFETWEDLSAYSWHVAGAVGLVSIRIFGCQNPKAETYAVALGHALQLTNILRDVGEDFTTRARIYLPQADLHRFGCHENDLGDEARDERFFQLMAFEADRAERFFREAEASAPQDDYRALTSARIMADIYRQLLHKMRRDGFKVFDKRYRLSKARKTQILAKHLIASYRFRV